MNVDGRLICRRCVVLYPIAFVVLALVLVGGIAIPDGTARLLLFLLPLPVVVDFVAEHLGFTQYSGRRQMICTAIGAPALGYSFARYLEDQGDRLFWIMVGAYGGVCFVAFLVYQMRERAQLEKIAAANDAEDPLIKGFASREQFESWLAERAPTDSRLT